MIIVSPIRESGTTFSDGREIRRRCGFTRPPAVQSSGSILWIRFLSDTNKETEKGFAIKALPVNGKSLLLLLHC